MKKLAVIALTSFMTFSGLNVNTVFANEESLSYIDGSDFQQMIDENISGTLVLESDVVSAETITISKDLNIDFNNHIVVFDQVDKGIVCNPSNSLVLENGKLTGEVSELLSVKGSGNIAVNNLSIENLIRDGIDNKAIYYNGTGSIEIQGCNISAVNGFSVYMSGKGTMNLESSLITGSSVLITGRGTSYIDATIDCPGISLSVGSIIKPKVEIIGGFYTSKNTDPLLVEGSNLIIHDGTFLGASGGQTDLKSFLDSSCKAIDEVSGKVIEQHQVTTSDSLEPTCDLEGYSTSESCETCGIILSESKPVPALGHEWAEWIVEREPDYEHEGLKVRECSRCLQREEELIEKLEKPEESEEPEIPQDEEKTENNQPVPPVSPSLPSQTTQPKPNNSQLGLEASSSDKQEMTNQTGTANSDETSEPEVAESLIFEDVEPDEWYSEGIEYCSLHGIMNGYENVLFGAENELTRGEAVMILWNMENRPETDEPNSFTDVKESDFYSTASRWAKSKGYMTGYSASLFGGNDNITREQLVTILWRYSGSSVVEEDLSGFAGSDEISDYAVSAMEWAVSNGVISGRGGLELAPRESITRAEMATIIWRIHNAKA